MKNEIIFVSILTVSLLLQLFLAFGKNKKTEMALKAGALNSLTIYLCILAILLNFVEVHTVAMALSIQVSMEIIIFGRLKRISKSRSEI